MNFKDLPKILNNFITSLTNKIELYFISLFFVLIFLSMFEFHALIILFEFLRTWTKKRALLLFRKYVMYFGYLLSNPRNNKKDFMDKSFRESAICWADFFGLISTLTYTHLFMISSTFFCSFKLHKVFIVKID